MSVRSARTTAGPRLARAALGLVCALTLTACGSQAADDAPDSTAVPSSTAGTSTVTTGTTTAPPTTSGPGPGPTTSAPGTDEPAVSVSTLPESTDTAGSTATAPRCGTTTYVDDRYHFMTSGHDFVQLCSADGGDQGVLLSYVYEDREITALPVLVDGGRDYALACGFAGPTPVCLVQATVSGGSAGSLVRLTDRGGLEEIGTTGPRSTIPMTLTAPSDEGAALLLVEGVVLPGGDDGFRTSTVSGTTSTVTGCGPATDGPPTGRLTGSCDGVI